MSRFDLLVPCDSLVVLVKYTGSVIVSSALNAGALHKHVLACSFARGAHLFLTLKKYSDYLPGAKSPRGRKSEVLFDPPDA